MPEEFWPQVQAAHPFGEQPAFIQAAAAENLIQMTSSFLPSDLSGILSYSTPPSPPPRSLTTHTNTPPIQPSQNLCSSLNAHPARLSLGVFFLSPCLPFHRLLRSYTHHTSTSSPRLPRASSRVSLDAASRLRARRARCRKLC